jgi:endonuclease/exonuclease/phosphatase family metal-dependent hydrolase
MTKIVVATFNAPHRLGPHTEAFNKIALVADVICAQEHTDTDHERNCPPGWLVHRPKRARSNVVYWNPSVVEAQKHGAPQVSSEDFNSLRRLVWVHFRTVMDNRPLRVASVHLPAFKTSRPRNAAEFRKQEKIVADWLSKGRFRVVAGDINAKIPSRIWTRNLADVGVWSDQVASGPHGQPIDYVGVNRCGPWKISNTYLDDKRSSDHKAVFATLTWKGRLGRLGAQT